MTPKEKAQQLVKKYLPNFIEQYDNHGFDDYDYNEDKAKECALIAVDEIIDALEKYDDRNDTYELQNMDGDFRYWDKVKQEIEKL